MNSTELVIGYGDGISDEEDFEFFEQNTAVFSEENWDV